MTATFVSRMAICTTPKPKGQSISLLFAGVCLWLVSQIPERTTTEGPYELPAIWGLTAAHTISTGPCSTSQHHLLAVLPSIHPSCPALPKGQVPQQKVRSPASSPCVEHQSMPFKTTCKPGGTRWRHPWVLVRPFELRHIQSTLWACSF